MSIDIAYRKVQKGCMEVRLYTWDWGSFWAEAEGGWGCRLITEEQDLEWVDSSRLEDSVLGWHSVSPARQTFAVRPLLIQTTPILMCLGGRRREEAEGGMRRGRQPRELSRFTSEALRHEISSLPADLKTSVPLGVSGLSECMTTL